MRDDEYDDDVLGYCPRCHSRVLLSACLLGKLGKLYHYRCRYCGGDWSHA